jgi:dTDP-4-amino-4,6-dideoxygalactose transaminase
MRRDRDRRVLQLPPEEVDHHGGGWRYHDRRRRAGRPGDILAAVGVVQMQRLPDIVARRTAVARRYRVLLSDVSGLGLPGDLPNRRHTFQSFVLRLPEGVDRDRVIVELRDDGIETTIGTYALHREPSYAGRFGYSPGDLASSMWAYQRSLTIPLYSTMTTADQDRVVDALRAALRNQGAR